MFVITILLVIVVCALLLQGFEKRFEASRRKLQPAVKLDSKFEDTLKAMSFADLLGVLAISNSVYVEYSDKTAFEQLCMADSELMYRFMEDLLTADQRWMVDMYFSSPETIMDKVKFSFVQS